MKLTIFQSDKGDCSLLEAASGELVLCDGGMGPSMRNQVRAELAALGRPIDLAYISHIDNDHISGVLQLLEDEVEWRVFDHHQGLGENLKPPKVPRPPKINGILHNGFRDLLEAEQQSLDTVKITSGDVQNLLVAMAPALFATAVPELSMAALDMQAITTGVPEGIRVSKLIASDALDIPLNQPPGANVPKSGRLLFAGRPGETFKLGSMKFTLIGPTSKEVKDLRTGWMHWLRNNKQRVKEMRAELKRRVAEFSAGSLSESPFDLRNWEGVPDFKGVTVPNIASMMWMVEETEAGRTSLLLLTGDGQQDFILDGLRRTGSLGSGDGDALHLDVLKVQHHGSEHNMDDEFARRVSADHYVFCGNGEHENPDLDVLNIVFNSRLGNDSSVRALAPQADNRPFKFWFSTTSGAQEKGTKKKDYFKKVENEVKKLVTKSNGQLTATFNTGTSTVLSF